MRARLLCRLLLLCRLHRLLDEPRLEVAHRREQVEERGEGRGHAGPVGSQHDHGEAAEVLTSGEGGEEGAQEAERELGAVDDEDAAKHPVEMLAGRRAAPHEGGVVVRGAGEQLLQLPLGEVVVVLCPYRLSKAGYEVVDVDSPAANALEQLVVDLRARDVPRGAQEVGLACDLLRRGALTKIYGY